MRNGYILKGNVAVGLDPDFGLGLDFGLDSCIDLEPAPERQRTRRNDGFAEKRCRTHTTSGISYARLAVKRSVLACEPAIELATEEGLLELLRGFRLSFACSRS